MTVFRVEKNKGYTVMSNYHLTDTKISLKAKGLLSQMLSLPENWDYTLRGLAKINREGVDAIRTAVLELEKAGYIQRYQSRKESGLLGQMVYSIFEHPVSNKSNKETFSSTVNVEGKANTLDINCQNGNLEPCLENPITVDLCLEKPRLENPYTETPTQLNTNQSNTYQQSTNVLSTENVSANTKALRDSDTLLSNHHHQSVCKDTGNHIDDSDISEGKYSVRSSMTATDSTKTIDFKVLSFLFPDAPYTTWLSEIKKSLIFINQTKLKKISINGDSIPVEYVRASLAKLNYGMVVNVLLSVSAIEDVKIRNKQSYLLTALFNELDSYTGDLPVEQWDLLRLRCGNYSPEQMQEFMVLRKKIKLQSNQINATN